MNITLADEVRGLRLILAAVNEDIDAANAVFAEAGAEPDGYVKLAMTSAQASAAALTRTVGVEHLRDKLLHDIEALLDREDAPDA
ncbi:hypothetical protein A2J03_10705 [Rhodococcus sp. EPR-157]|uniref:hypothetical protein n=1 Tax=Rhodococcus sp. EPR-157 TaxID=1813677 RepID=UPI0007BBA971|nr:hypothetical protein [Rhodococcus sp. EPR-157]KZF01024.1 hypothetical protein A2J03_10705 [Rhodococcus sp. EPR-157]